MAAVPCGHQRRIRQRFAILTFVCLSSQLVSGGRVPICDLKGNCDEADDDPVDAPRMNDNVRLAGSEDVPSADTMLRMARFSDIQRLIRKDPTIRENLLDGLSKKVPELYDAIRGKEEEFIASLTSNRPIGSTLEPDEYVIVNKQSRKALDYAVQDSKLITYRWMNTLNQKWTYTPEGTLELSQLKGDRMSVLDVWTDLKGGEVHNGMMVYSKHWQPQSKVDCDYATATSSRSHSHLNGMFLLLTMGDQWKFHSGRLQSNEGPFGRASNGALLPGSSLSTNSNGCGFGKCNELLGLGKRYIINHNK
eukprot:FR744270.1.p1 GENE.FR744270.1~~FR744270.1.p1  ORF type:complete len:306 (+),score=19.85 FR744270.1:93-1010(+)